MSTRVPTPSAASALRTQQQRVTAVLDALPEEAWHARLTHHERTALVATGHFPQFSGELDWTPQEITGHLRDSARIFTSRLHRLLREKLPALGSFDPLDADRVAGYTATPRALLLADLHDAQQQLHAAVAAVRETDLARAGLRADAGPVDVAELLRFLPGHQADHATQLEALARPTGGGLR